jgi:hypothetical protein
MSEVAVKNLIWIGSQRLSGLFEHPFNFCEYFELLSGRFDIRQLPLEVLVGISTHHNAFLVSYRIHYEIDNFSLSLFEIVKSGQGCTDCPVKMIIVVTKYLLR